MAKSKEEIMGEVVEKLTQATELQNKILAKHQEIVGLINDEIKDIKRDVKSLANLMGVTLGD